jgi:hypothetical protein
MNILWSDEPMAIEHYSVGIAAREFAEFVLKNAKSSGWQGRVSQRWDREMARLIEYLRVKKIDEDRTAQNYVYSFRTEVRELIEALPKNDPRREELKDFEQRLPTPQAFLKAGERFSLKASLADFADYAVKTGVRGWKNWHEDVEARWVLERAAMAVKTQATQKNYISRYRKAVMNRLDEEENVREGLMEELLSIVRHPPELLEQVNAAYDRKVRDEVRNQVVISEWKPLIMAFRDCLNADNPRLKLIGLMALTGRRFFEVASSGDFSLHTRELPGGARVVSKWVIQFEGQAKTRGAEGTKSGEVYNIPCLAPAKDILRAFIWLRNSAEGQLWASMDSKELNAKVNNQVNRYLRTREEFLKYWPEDDKLTTKCLRSFYAEVAYKTFAPSNMEKSPYYAQILGHSETDLQTALSYMDYRLEVEDTEAARQEMQRLIDQLNEQATTYGRTVLPAEDQEADRKAVEDDGFEVIEDDPQ